LRDELVVVVALVGRVADRDAPARLARGEVDAEPLDVTGRLPGRLHHEPSRAGDVPDDLEGHLRRGLTGAVALVDADVGEVDRRQPLCRYGGKSRGGGAQVGDPDPAAVAGRDQVDLVDVSEVDPT